MRRVDPGLPIDIKDVPEWGKRLIAAVYELENKRPKTPTFALNDGTVDRAVYDYLEFAGTDVSGVGVDGVKVTTAEKGTWTPTDASGASLSFAAASGVYVRFPIGLVIATADVTYPATASGANAAIGSLPYTVGSASHTAGSYTTYANPITVLAYTATSVVFLQAAGGGASITNANMTLKQIIFTVAYQT